METDYDKKISMWNATTFVIISVTGFLNFTLYLKSYDSSLFGYYLLLGSAFGVGSTLDFGFGIATVKYIAEAYKEKNFILINRIYVTLFFAYIFLALVIFGFISAYTFIFIKDDHVISQKDFEFNIIFLLISLTFFTKYISGFLRNVFEGLKKFIMLCKIFITIAIIQTLLAVCIFIFDLHIVYLALLTLLPNIISIFVLLYFAITSENFLKLKISLFSFGLIKKYAKYSIYVQASYLIAGFIDPIVKYLIGTQIALNYVTYYETSRKIIDFSTGVIFSAQKGLINKISEHKLTLTLNEFINNGLTKYSRISNNYSVVLYGMLNPLILVFILFWFDSYDSAVICLIFFLPYSLINFAGCLHNVIVIDSPGFVVLAMQIANLVFTCLFLFISINILGNYLGLLGFYLATIISLVLIFFVLKRRKQIDVWKYLKNTETNDLIKLNILLISQVILFFVFKEYYQYLLGAYFVLFNIVFFKYFKSLKDMFLRLVARRN